MKAHYSEMNKRISIFAQYKVPDKYDGYTLHWKKIRDVWAKVDFLSENKEDGKYKELIKSMYVFTVRNNQDFKMPLKINYLNRSFMAKKLQSSDNQKEYISIIAEMGGNHE